MNSTHNSVLRGLYHKPRKCALVDMDGKQRYFPSEKSASRYLGRSDTYMKSLRDRGESVATSIAGGYYCIYYLDEETKRYVSAVSAAVSTPPKT